MRALIYIQAGAVSAAKQTTACLQWAMRNGYTFSIVKAGAWMEAVRLISEGQADVLLLAFADEGVSRQIIAAVEAVGGRVEFCRPSRRPPAPRLAGPGHTTDELVINAARRGVEPEQIQVVLGVPLERIRRILGQQRRTE
jgi:hypothetical protein